MNNKPIISVVMSVYNAEKHLTEAIESILVQTYKNFEFIIINDGSTDKSLEIIEKYKSKDERIILISRENKGLVASLNEGIEKSKGKYIARMDADDISLPERFEEQMIYIKKNKLDLCGSWTRPFNDKKVFSIRKYQEEHKDISFQLFFMSSFAHPTVIMNRDIFKYLTYQNELAEDYQLWCDVVSNGFKVGNIQKVLLNYRVHENQLTKLKFEGILTSTKKIKLSYASKTNKDMIYIINKIFISHYNANYKLVKEIFHNIINISKYFEISENTLNEIFEIIYKDSYSNNLFIYLLYKKNTKFLYKNIKKEIELFVRAIIPMKKGTNFYNFALMIKKRFE